MQKAALFLSVLAVGGAGFAVWKVSCPTCGTKRPDAVAPSDAASYAAVVARLDEISRRLDAIEAAPKPLSGPGLATAPPAPSPARATPSASTPSGGGKAATGGTVEERLSAVETAIEEARKREEANPMRFARGPYARTPIMTMDAAKKELDLTDGQRAEWERIVSDAKRDLEALKRIPDDEGKTWEQAQQEVAATLLASAAGGTTARLDMSNVFAFQKKTIPGRNETYGQADQRIRDDAKRRMRDTLTPDQQSRYERATVDPLLGAGPGGTAISIGVMGPSPATPDPRR